MAQVSLGMALTQKLRVRDRNFRDGCGLWNGARAAARTADGATPSGASRAATRRPQHCSAPWAAPSQPDERPYAVTYGAASLSTERELSRKYRNCIQIQIYTTGAYVSMLSRLCAVIARFWFNRSKFRLAIYSFLCQRT